MQITFSSFNIENVKGNYVAVNHINENYKNIDIYYIQEHWLHGFEKDKMIKNIPGYRHFTRCYDDDDNENASLYMVRGHGGISLLWKNEWAPHIKELKNDGNKRIQAVMLKDQILLINCYLPSGPSKQNCGVVGHSS